MAQQKHQVAANTLMQQIFTRQRRPGEKLPPEKELAQELQVDRNALRVAVKIMQSMGVLDVRQGDGMYVRDYVHNAGIDFLRLLISRGDPGAALLFTDQYLADEILEAWTMIFPAMMAAAAPRLSAVQIRELFSLLDEEEAGLDLSDRDALVELEVRSQDIIVEALDNTVLLMLVNSFRPLRKMMFTLFLQAVDKPLLRRHNQIKRALIKAYISGSPEETLARMEQFNRHLELFRGLIRRSWAEGDS